MVLTGFGIAVPALRSQEATRNPAQAEVRQPMTHLDDGAGVIALTIDDGPSPVYTPQILRLLERYRITASFSMIGINVDTYPGVAREVTAAGHMIVNHTWTHQNLAHLSSAGVYDQMDYAADAIHRVTGRLPQMFRAPYGVWTPTVLQWCQQTPVAPAGLVGGPARLVAAGHRRHHPEHPSSTPGPGPSSWSTTAAVTGHRPVAALRVVLPRLLAAGFRFRTP